MKLSKRERLGRANKGSQLHLQNLINKNPNLLNGLILDTSPTLRDAISGTIKWTSPLESVDFLEYQDEEFLETIGYLQLNEELLNFWPKGGPVWDALAIFSTKKKDKNGVILLEAKSHAKELSGGGCSAGGQSRDKIFNAFEQVKNALRISGSANWMGKYYQYANRLAHLYFLSVIHEIPTWLVFLYFVGDQEQGGPMKQEDWYGSLDDTKKALGLNHQHSLSDYIINVFPELEKLR